MDLFHPASNPHNIWRISIPKTTGISSALRSDVNERLIQQMIIRNIAVHILEEIVSIKKKTVMTVLDTPTKLIRRDTIGAGIS